MRATKIGEKQRDQYQKRIKLVEKKKVGERGTSSSQPTGEDRTPAAEQEVGQKKDPNVHPRREIMGMDYCYENRGDRVIKDAGMHRQKDVIERKDNSTELNVQDKNRIESAEGQKKGSGVKDSKKQRRMNYQVQVDKTDTGGKTIQVFGLKSGKKLD